MTRRLIIEVDDELCVNSQNCVYSAPSTFALGDGVDDTATVLPEPHDDDAMVVEAGRGCPQGAIAVRDADTGKDLLELGGDGAPVTWRTPGAGGDRS